MGKIAAVASSSGSDNGNRRAATATRRTPADVNAVEQVETELDDGVPSRQAATQCCFPSDDDVRGGSPVRSSRRRL